MFILASGSPRRKELLAKLVKEYEIIVPKVDEKSIEGKFPPFQLPVEESKLKAYAIRDMHPNDEILACDTIVLLGDNVLGKPHTEDVAYKMLKNESGKTQTVISGYTYIGHGIEINRTVTSTVVFNELNDDQIWDYIKKYQPLDKAGAYGIQDEAGLIKCIEGSYDNVMGLPVEDLRDNVFNRLSRK